MNIYLLILFLILITIFILIIIKNISNQRNYYDLKKIKNPGFTDINENKNCKEIFEQITEQKRECYDLEGNQKGIYLITRFGIDFQLQQTPTYYITACSSACPGEIIGDLCSVKSNAFDICIELTKPDCQTPEKELGMIGNKKYYIKTIGNAGCNVI